MSREILVSILEKFPAEKLEVRGVACVVCGVLLAWCGARCGVHACDVRVACSV